MLSELLQWAWGMLLVSVVNTAVLLGILALLAKKTTK